VILSDRELKERLARGDLIVDPLHEPDVQIQPASIDLRLGGAFLRARDGTGPIDSHAPPPDLHDEVRVAPGEPLVLGPGDFVLGSTLERVSVPRDLVARVEGRSTIGRLALLIHATAGFIDPGFEGEIALELANLGRLPVVLHPRDARLPDRVPSALEPGGATLRSHARQQVLWPGGPHCQPHAAKPMTPFDLLVRGGDVVTPWGITRVDVGVRSGLITDIGFLGGAATKQTLDAEDLTVLPGIIDSQVHFREPGLEHKEDLTTGTRAAALGGVTTVLEMPNTRPPTTNRAALDDKIDRARGRICINVGFFVGATRMNLAELATLENAPPCAGVKVFHGSSTGDLLLATESDLEAVLRTGRRRVAIHAEDEERLVERRSLMDGAPVSRHPHVRDVESAVRATERCLRVARLHAAPSSRSPEPPACMRATRSQNGRRLGLASWWLLQVRCKCAIRSCSVLVRGPVRSIRGPAS
jgi:deoxycytidine triphosphate deaminase